MSTVSTDDVVFDPSIYPRGAATQSTIDQYADALLSGDVFPPIVLEPDTNRLYDGYHRWQAHKQAGRTEVEAVWRSTPAGVPEKLFAASLSVKHGDRIKGDELKRIARDIITKDTGFDINTIARHCGVTRQTAGRWVSDIVDFRRDVRRLRAYIMAQAGWKTREIAEFLGIDHSTVVRDVKDDILHQLTEPMLRDAVENLPDTIDGESYAEELRQQQIFATWDDEQRDLVKRLRAGETLVANLRGQHDKLIEWATQAGLYERVDRNTDWGNPFIMGKDGDRETVIANYANHYLPHKPSLLKRIGQLRGKTLGCWCAPEPCHADVLKSLAEQ